MSCIFQNQNNQKKVKKPIQWISFNASRMGLSIAAIITLLCCLNGSSGISLYGKMNYRNSEIRIHSTSSSVTRSSFTSNSPFYDFGSEPQISSSHQSNKAFVITMGKGDGKKKRPKKKSSSSSSVAPTPAPIAPLRVSNDINVPIRRQIRYAQMKKEALRSSGTSFRANNVKRTAYRKNLGELNVIL